MIVVGCGCDYGWIRSYLCLDAPVIVSGRERDYMGLFVRVIGSVIFLKS